MKTSLIAAALFALSVGAAHAGEGNGEPFPNNTEAGRFVVANSIQDDTGSESAPRFGPVIASLATNTLLPANSNEAEIQTANSLPLGAMEGTVAYADAQSMHRWMIAHQVPVQRTAAR